MKKYFTPDIDILLLESNEIMIRTSGEGTFDDMIGGGISGSNVTTGDVGGLGDTIGGSIFG